MGQKSDRPICTQLLCRLNFTLASPLRQNEERESYSVPLPLHDFVQEMKKNYLTEYHIKTSEKRNVDETDALP
jgi:hypothetical protein